MQPNEEEPGDHQRTKLGVADNVSAQQDVLRDASGSPLIFREKREGSAKRRETSVRARSPRADTNVDSESAQRKKRADRLTRQTARRIVRQPETTASTQPAQTAPQDKSPGPSYTHAELGTVHERNVAKLSVDERKKLFADIEQSIRRGENQRGIDAFLKVPAINSAWSTYIADTRPTYSMSVQEFLDLSDEDRRAEFASMRADLVDLHFSRPANKFMTACSNNVDFSTQWTYFVKTGDIVTTDSLWVERNLWAALGYNTPQGPFATEGLNKAKENKDLMTAVMRTLHSLRKKDQSRVLPWLEDKQNRKVEELFDTYLRKLKGPERSYSRTDGTTRKMYSSRFTDKQWKRAQKNAARLKSEVDQIEARRAKKKGTGGRWTYGDEDGRTKAKEREFWAKFATNAELNPWFIKSYLYGRGVNKMSTDNKEKFLHCFAIMLLDPTYTKQARIEIRDLEIKHTYGDSPDQKINRGPLRKALKEWAQLSIKDADEKTRVLALIEEAKNKGTRVISTF